jgi:hypothetical protein
VGSSEKTEEKKESRKTWKETKRLPTLAKLLYVSFVALQRQVFAIANI